MKRLSDEALKALKPDVPMCQTQVECCDCSGQCGEVSQAEQKNTLEQVVKWIEARRETPLGKDPYGYYIWEADLQAIKKIIEGK